MAELFCILSASATTRKKTILIQSALDLSIFLYPINVYMPCTLLVLHVGIMNNSQILNHVIYFENIIDLPDNVGKNLDCICRTRFASGYVIIN